MGRSIEITGLGLSAYEREQLRAIESWKATAPHRGVGELFKKVTMPGARLLERVIPDRWIVGCVERSYQLALEMAADDLERRDHRSSDTERSLEECDALAEERCARANATAAMQGVLTGAGGFVTTFADVPLLLALSIRTVMRVGHCYGYALRGPGDRRFVMSVLVAGTSGSLKMKRQRLLHLQTATEWVSGRSQEEMIAEELFTVLFHMELFEEIPGLGAVTGGLLNLGFMRRLSETARRVFQERWLRDRGKIDESRVLETALGMGRGRLRGRLSRAANSTCYCLAFGVSLPASVVVSTLSPFGGLLGRGTGGTDGVAVSEPRS